MLSSYLSDAKDISDKIVIGRQTTDIVFKLIGATEKLDHNVERFWNKIIKLVNKIAEDKKMDIRCTSHIELRNISMDSRKSLNKTILGN